MLYTGFLGYSLSSLWPYVFWQGLGIEGQGVECLWSSQDSHNYCSSIGLAPGLGTLSNQDKQLQLRYWCGPISIIYSGWKIKTSSIIQQVPVSCGKELWDPQQGDASYYSCSRRVEVFPGKSSQPGGDLDWPQKPGVFHDHEETEPQTGILVPLLGPFWLHTLPPPWMIYG